MESKHSRGRFVADGMSVRLDSDKVEYLLLISKDADRKEEAEANAQLIADAFNVTNETGMTPRELQKSHQELLESIESLCLKAFTHYRDNDMVRGHFELWKSENLDKFITNATKP